MPITQPYDVADYLTDDETVLAYLEEALATNEPRLIAQAIAAVARARSRTVASEAISGKPLEALSARLREDDGADLKTIFEALSALGFKLTPVLRTPASLAA